MVAKAMRLIGKIWREDEEAPAKPNFIAHEVDPDRKNLAARALELRQTDSPIRAWGTYAVRTTGRFSRKVNWFEWTEDRLTINGNPVTKFDFDKGTLRWTGGSQACFEGRVTLLIDPIIGSVEFFVRIGMFFNYLSQKIHVTIPLTECIAIHIQIFTYL